MENNDFPHSFVAIDFETFGGKRLYVCQVGMAKYADGQLTDTFSRLVCPPPGAPTRYKRVHDITPDMVKDAPTFAELLPEIEAFVGQLPLVAHNGLAVERACIRENLSHYGLSTALCYENMLDTLKIAKVVLPDTQHDLTFLCRHYGICDDDHHDAAADARMCGELYLLLIEEPGAETALLPQMKAPRTAPTHFVEKKYRAEDMVAKTDLSKYADNPFRGKYVCMTGFSHEACEYYGEKLSQMGATMRACVTGKVNILVLGDTPGWAKISKAEELGLTIMHGYEMEEIIDKYRHSIRKAQAEMLNVEDGEDEEPPLKDKIIGITLLVVIGSAAFYGLTHCLF